jgi:hypothetical protein
VSKSPFSAGSATCTVEFKSSKSLTDPKVTVAAQYSGDDNFSPGSGTTSQVVQDFGVQFDSPSSASGALAPVYLTQGFTNQTDPFNPTPVKGTLFTSGQFNQLLSATCSVTTVRTSAPVSDPSCSPYFSTRQTQSTIDSYPLVYTLRASSSAPVGSYQVSIAVVSNGPVSIMRQTPTSLLVYVVGQSSALTFAQGGTGTLEDVSFNTAAAPASDTLQSFACGKVSLSGAVVNGVQTYTPVSNADLNCANQTTAPVPVSVEGMTAVTITISSGSSSAQLKGAGTGTLAAMLGLPVLALLGWSGRLGSRRRNIFRFIALLMIAGTSFAVTSCGGSYTKTGGAFSKGGLAPGTYLVQVIAFDGPNQTGNKYYAVVPLTVNPNQ